MRFLKLLTPTGNGEPYPDGEANMNRFGTEANYWQVKLSRTHENGNEIFMNGPIVSSILPNTAMKQSIAFFLLPAANRETCKPKRMNETGEDIDCKSGIQFFCRE